MRTVSKIPKRLTRAWLKRWADRMAEKADVKDPYWFIHNAGGECGTFCFDCGEKRRAELQKEFSGDKDVLENLRMLDGGRSQECDGVEVCDKCGQLLHYSLTDYGAEEEWDHFRESGISLSSPEIAYEIQSIIDHGIKLTGLSKVRLIGKLPAALRRGLSSAGTPSTFCAGFQEASGGG